MDDDAPTLLPPRGATQVADSMNAAEDMLAAATGLALALEMMPGPVWAILNDRHAAEGHAAGEPGADCVPCQFDRLLAAARRHDPGAGQFRDPGELFALPDDLFPRRAHLAGGVEGEGENPTPPSIALVADGPDSVYERRGTITGRIPSDYQPQLSRSLSEPEEGS